VNREDYLAQAQQRLIASDPRYGEMIAAVESNGFRRPSAPAPAPRPAPPTPAPTEQQRPPEQPALLDDYCVVGRCDPVSRETRPRDLKCPGPFCKRHWAKLSRPMDQELASAAHSKDRAWIQRVVAEATKQARMNSAEWRRP
jgi:hypothetical protein